MEIFHFQILDQQTYNEEYQVYNNSAVYRLQPVQTINQSWEIHSTPHAAGEEVLLFSSSDKNEHYLVSCSYNTANEIREMLKTTEPEDVLNVIRSTELTTPTPPQGTRVRRREKE